MINRKEIQSPFSLWTFSFSSTNSDKWPGSRHSSPCLQRPSFLIPSSINNYTSVTLHRVMGVQNKEKKQKKKTFTYSSFFVQWHNCVVDRDAAVLRYTLDTRLIVSAVFVAFIRPHLCGKLTTLECGSRSWHQGPHKRRWSAHSRAMFSRWPGGAARPDHQV